MRTIRLTGLALAGFLASLASVPIQAQSVDLKPAAKVKRDKYVITAEEIAERQDLTNAYDAVKLLRSDFLKTTRARGSISGSSASGGYRPEVVGRPVREGTATTPTTSTGEPRPTVGGRDDGGAGGLYASSSGGAAATTAVLYIDEVKQPTIEEMKNVRAADVVEIRYMTGNQAAGRYGSGHEGGAILLKTQRTRSP